MLRDSRLWPAPRVLQGVASTAPKRDDSCVFSAGVCRWTSECISSVSAASPPRSCSRGARQSEQPIASEFKTKERKQMSVLRAVTTNVFCLALMGVVFSPGAKADDWNRKTVMTFSGPVEIPGVHLVGWAVLPAGTYVFRSEEHTSELQSLRNLV